MLSTQNELQDFLYGCLWGEVGVVRGILLFAGRVRCWIFQIKFAKGRGRLCRNRYLCQSFARANKSQHIVAPLNTDHHYKILAGHFFFHFLSPLFRQPLFRSACKITCTLKYVFSIINLSVEASLSISKNLVKIKKLRSIFD